MRSVYCGDLRLSDVDSEVTLCGWVDRRRVFGDFIFAEIRDREGSIQVFFDPSHDYNTFVSASQLRNEYCVQVTGIVRVRPLSQINFNMKTGEIEVLASNLKIISVSEPLPLDLNKDNSEEKRLLYRYLDLRRPIMLERLKNRSRITAYIHRFMEKKGFLNIETPMLTHSTPEGARNYLVPSRLHKGKYYALPQSPQVFKQLLMISGFDRYYQITKCFRDEDMRSDRQPEFTQLDLETSFMDTEEVREIVECLVRELWHEMLDVELEKFPQLTYKEVINRFASDSPDLRNPIKIFYISNIDLEEIKCNIVPILDRRDNMSLRIMIMYIPNGARISCEKICQYINDFKVSGGTNLSWVRICGYGSNRKIEGSAVHFYSLNVLERIFFQTSLSENDLLFLSYGHRFFSNYALCRLRSKLGHDLELINKGSWAPLWVVDFPMFKKDVQGNIVSMHHLFTAPKNTNAEHLLKNPLSAISSSFDMVINGYEVGSGSMRIHSNEMQKVVFKILGLSEHMQKEQFGFLLNALKYGAPIHAGIACGLDRLVMLLNGTSNIRDVIAFPKTAHAVDLMTKTPGYFHKD